MKRPTIATALGALGIFGSGMSLLTGMVILLDNNRVQDFASVGLGDSELKFVAGVIIAVAAFGLYLAVSILNGQKWARVWYTIIGALNITSAAWMVISHTGDARWSALTSGILWVITLQLLYNNKADSFFEGN